MRIPLVCNHDDSTVVLAHYRRGGVAGMKQKPPDLCGAWACSSCHDEIDGRTHKLREIYHTLEEARETLAACMLDGMNRTLAQISKEVAIGKKR